VLEKLNIQAGDEDMTEWKTMVEKILHPTKSVIIGVVGKYVALPDAYMSVTEALRHAGFSHGASVQVKWVDAEHVENCNGDLAKYFDGVDGILVPGGFGDRGIEGKIRAIQYARENKIPFFGLCLGMQCAVIEYARHVCGLTAAHSTEFDPLTEHPVIDLMPEQATVVDKGGTMRRESTLQSHADTNTYTPIRMKSSTNGTATGSSSTTPTGKNWSVRASFWAAPCRTTGWWKWWKSRTIPGSWAPSSIRNSNPGRPNHTRCSAILSRRR
jgi:CTP synthase (UTP-ammonia lyase)